jgi:hypothetical protein
MRCCKVGSKILQQLAQLPAVCSKETAGEQQFISVSQQRSAAADAGIEQSPAASCSTAMN